MLALLMPLLGGTTGKMLMVVGGLLALLAAGTIALHEHDLRRDAARVAAETAATLKVERAANAAAMAALQAQVDGANARAAQVATVKEIIRNVPVTRDCAASPAIRAALDGLRGGSGPPGPGPGRAPVAAGVQAAAGAGADRR